jgi:hypothetical protein
MVRRLRFSSLLAALAAGSLAFASTASAQNMGFARMPSTVPQYFGFGYGAGHHAPMVRTPGNQPFHVDRRVRVPARCGRLSPAPYAPIGCYGPNCAPGAFAYPAPPETAPPPTYPVPPEAIVPMPPAPLPPVVVPAPEPVANHPPTPDNRQAWQPLMR